MTELVLETKNRPTKTGELHPQMAITPPIDKDYWQYRVRLSDTQAIVGFPKFFTIGIGFAVEEDWNTNLPYTSDTGAIYEHIEHNKGGLEPADIKGADFWNYTSNCARMWRLAGADLAEFDGKTAGDCLIALDAAIMTMKRDPLPYLALNPNNGWGSYNTLLPALDELAAMFQAHPKATVVVSR